MFDSSLGGFGILKAALGKLEVENIAKFDERWRFKKDYQGSQQARKKALPHADPFSDPSTVLPVDCSGAPYWLQRKSFPAVPDTALKADKWKEVVAGPWRDRESIHVLEGRAGGLCVKTNPGPFITVTNDIWYWETTCPVSWRFPRAGPVTLHC